MAYAHSFCCWISRSIRVFSLSSGEQRSFSGNTDTTRMILPWESCVRVSQTS